MKKSLPTVIAGPVLRHTDAKHVVWWLVTSIPVQIHAELFDSDKQAIDLAHANLNQETFCVGQKAFIQTISLSTDAIASANFADSENLKTDDDKDANSSERASLLKQGALYYYDLKYDLKTDLKNEQKNNVHSVSNENKEPRFSESLFKDIPNITYPGYDLPNFRFNKTLTKVIHGSCRKPHFYGKDALPQLDELVKQELVNSEERKTKRPDLMLMTGDQVYVDDVAGPTLSAIHQVINLLGLHNENFEGATVDDLDALMTHEHGFYHRELLLPKMDANDKLSKAFFAAKRKPIFTSVNAKNHLIALSEMLALYMLTWSPTLWQFVTLNKSGLSKENQAIYNDEKQKIEAFKSGLGSVQRALAHVPSYMIFDDHDVTDDWNLTRGWEQQIYGHPFSKRIIGNAIMAYFLCQACGNPRFKLEGLFSEFRPAFSVEKLHRPSETSTDINKRWTICDVPHNILIDKLLGFDQWHYNLDTHPPVHVLDTRTQRWRSESSLNKPSGLMDWEALCELQQSILGKDSVIMVSAAPVYGVKFIEMIQKVFTLFGGALIVDAENWMAHRGTASVMLNIFRHIKTPPNFIILSGDVHYSFVYDVGLRFRRNSPHITQFTSSGIHNEFPPRLLRWFDRLNRWFYGYRSPLNWLTKRRNMSVRQRQPDKHQGTLVNGSNIGILTLNEDATQVDCALLLSDGSRIDFSESKTQLRTKAHAKMSNEG